MEEVALVRRTLADLEKVVDYLERMNLREQTGVPDQVIQILTAAGLADTKNIEPSALLPRVLDRQQMLRRRLATIRREGATS